MRTDSRSPRFLWITPKYPLGAMDGARHATGVLLRHLVRLGAAIDLICLLPDHEAADSTEACARLGVKSCMLIRRSGAWFRSPPSWNIPITFRTFAALRKEKTLYRTLMRMTRRSAEPREAVTVFDGLHTFAALDARDLGDLFRATRIVYRAHNVESVLWEQGAKNSPSAWLRWSYRHQAALIRTFERQMAEIADRVAAVSTEDAHRFKALAPRGHAASIPIGIDFPLPGSLAPVALDASAFEILFIGRLDWRPNKEGLLWFLKNVWPAVMRRQPERTLKIAGVGDDRWLKPFSKMAGVTCLGQVATLDPLYQSCALTLAPIFQGSGTRVKILESARFARPVLSTALGAEGSGLIPGLSYFQAESQADWIRLLSSLTLADCRAAGLRAFYDARDRFEGSAVARRFMDLFETREPACLL